MRIALDNYLTLADRVHAADAAVYAWVLKCKGAVTAEQFLIHLQRRKSGVAKLFDELQATATRLSALDGELPHFPVCCPIPRARAKGESDQDEIRRREMRGASRLQQQLVAKNRRFSQAKSPPCFAPRTFKRPCRRSRPSSTLSNTDEYPRLAPGKAERTPERRLLAFVVRPDGPIHKVDLGPADLIQDKVARWTREVIGRRDSDSAGISGGTAEADLETAGAVFGSGRNGRRFARRLALPVSLLCSARRNRGAICSKNAGWR